MSETQFNALIHYINMAVALHDFRSSANMKILDHECETLKRLLVVPLHEEN